MNFKCQQKEFLGIRTDYMGKVLVISFEENEEMVLNELLNYFNSQGYLIPFNAFPDGVILKYDNLTIDPKCRRVRIGGEMINLTNYEFKALYLLAKNPGRVFSKEQIYYQVWNEPYRGAENNVMSLIRRIRKKIEPDSSKPIFILTVWGVGYKFNNEIKKK